MAEYEVNGVTYEFPDNFTPAQVQDILRSKGVIPNLREQERTQKPPSHPKRPTPPPLSKSPSPKAKVEVGPITYQQTRFGESEPGEPESYVLDPTMESPVGDVPFVPLGRMKPEPPSYTPQVQLTLKDEEVVQQRFEKEWEARKSRFKDPALAAKEAERLRQEIQKGIQEERAKVSTPGGEAKTPLQGGLPFFRPTRMVEYTPTESVVDPDTGIVTEEPAALPIGAKARKPETLYRDSETGVLRTPTVGEELTEAMARQVVMSKDEAKLIADAIKKGEKDAPWIKGVLSTRDPSGAVVETSLGAVLRSVPSYMENLVAEAYFRGLGYEVDEKGAPKDTSDFGYKIAQAREKLGLPATMTPGGPILAAFEAIGVPEVGTTVVPLPGVATRREAPDAEKAAESSDVPLGSRVARGVVKGRGLMEEFSQAPEVVQAAETYFPGRGEEAAKASGMAYSLLVPAGPGTAVRALTKVGKVGKETALAGKGVALTQDLIDRGADLASSIPTRLEPYIGAKGGGLVDGIARYLAGKAASAAKPVAEGAKSAVTLAGPTALQKARILERATKALYPPSQFPDFRIPDEVRSSPNPKAWARLVAEHEQRSGFMLFGDITETEKNLERALTRVLPADLVVVSPLYAAPRGVARNLQTRAAELRKADPGLTPDKAVEKAALEVGKDLRRIDEASELQVSLDSFRTPRALEGLASNTVRGLFGKPWLNKRASVTLAEQQIAGQARESLRRLSSELQAQVKKGKTPEEALDEAFSRYMEKAGESPEDAWRAILGENYGEEGGLAQRLFETHRNLTTTYPTLAAMRTIDEAKITRDMVPGVGRPAFQRNMLNVLLEDGVRKTIVKGAKEEYARVFRNSVRPGTVDETRFDPKSEIWTLASEKKFAEGEADLAKMLDSVPTAKRGEFFRALTDNLKQATVKSLRGLKYGYILPNAPFLLRRALAVPVISIAQIGLARTLGAARNALTSGGTFKAADGTTYTPDAVEGLIQKYGIGTTAVEQERIGRLAQDLWDDVIRAEGLSPLVAANPATRGWVVRVAHDAEVAYRRGVFVEGLRDGLTPQQASNLARKSLFDYSQTPSWVRESIGRYLATAAEQYSAFQLLIDTGVRNPELITPLLKAQSKKNESDRRDEKLKELFPIPKSWTGESLIGPKSPVMAPLEDALALTYGASKFVDALTSGEPVSAAAGLIGGGAEVLTPEVLDVLGGLSALRAAKYESGDEAGVKSLDDRMVFYTALKLVEQYDPNGDFGIRDLVWSSLDPIDVKAPASVRDPDDPYSWLARPPEGTPYFYLGKNAQGIETYRVRAPSKQGLARLKVLRGLTPESLIRLGGATALLTASPGVDIQDLSPTGRYDWGAGVLTYLGLDPSPAPSKEELAKDVLERAEKR